MSRRAADARRRAGAKGAPNDAPNDAPRPNVVVIVADDLGYGDPGRYNPDSRIPTPHIDALAARGLRLTDAHAPAAVCTPSRYGLLTGRYGWRSALPHGVLYGYEPPLIEPGRMTLAGLLSAAGYRTAAVGKWHLGLGFSPRPASRPTRSSRTSASWSCRRVTTTVRLSPVGPDVARPAGVTTRRTRPSPSGDLARLQGAGVGGRAPRAAGRGVARAHPARRYQRRAFALRRGRSAPPR